MLWCMGSQRVEHDLATEQQQSSLNHTSTFGPVWDVGNA